MGALKNIFFLVVVIVGGLSNGYAQSEQEIEQHYQKGSQYFQQGLLDNALMEFSAIVESDHASLSQGYYVEAYADAFANIGIIYGKKNDL